jgi:hypothetical protein
MRLFPRQKKKKTLKKLIRYSNGKIFYFEIAVAQKFHFNILDNKINVDKRLTVVFCAALNSPKC